jgi:hypothetical protein
MRRRRPSLLTPLTETFGGLPPIIFETSSQAGHPPAFTGSAGCRAVLEMGGLPRDLQEGEPSGTRIDERSSCRSRWPGASEGDLGARFLTPNPLDVNAPELRAIAIAELCHAHVGVPCQAAASRCCRCSPDGASSRWREVKWLQIELGRSTARQRRLTMESTDE